MNETTMISERGARDLAEGRKPQTRPAPDTSASRQGRGGKLGMLAALLLPALIGDVFAGPSPIVGVAGSPAGPVKSSIHRLIPPAPDTFQEITAGRDHTCARRYDGKVYCWGTNVGKESGPVTTAHYRGAAVVDRPTQVPGLTAKRIDAGHHHTCALDMAGKAVCWGRGNNGQLGMGLGVTSWGSNPVSVHGSLTFTSISAGAQTTCGTATTGMYCWGFLPGFSSPGATVPTLIFGFNGYSQVSVGWGGACGLYVVGTVSAMECWGANYNGQLGIHPGLFPVAPPTLSSSLGMAVARMEVGGFFSCADQLSGIVQCVGANDRGYLGNGSTVATHLPQTVGAGMPLRGVTVGPLHACALSPAGEAYCWGEGPLGQLGTGQRSNTSTPQKVVGGHTFRAIAAGERHTCAIGTDNRLYCWGDNLYGQLGTAYPQGLSTSEPVQAMFPN